MRLRLVTPLEEAERRGGGFMTRGKVVRLHPSRPTYCEPGVPLVRIWAKSVQVRSREGGVPQHKVSRVAALFALAGRGVSRL